MKTNIATPSLALLTKTIIDDQGLTFLAGTYPTNQFGGSDGEYLALALDDRGRVYRFTGIGPKVTRETLRTASSALATWRKIVDNPWHGFDSSWEATRRFLMDLGHLYPQAEPQEAQDWSVEDCGGHEGAVLASVKDQGTRLVLGTDHGSHFEALTIGEDGQTYRTISTTECGALTTKIDSEAAWELWRQIIDQENFTSRNDGVELFLTTEGRKAGTLAKAA